MTSLLVLIPISLGMGLIGLGAFFWAMRNDQFDDPEGNAWRVLASEDYPKHKPPEAEVRRHGSAADDHRNDTV